MNDRRKDTFGEIEEVASFTECTGLMPFVPDTDEEDRDLAALYGIHSGKAPGKRRRTK